MKSKELIIKVEWQPEGGAYRDALIVTESQHPRFTKGSRFDFGFLEIATKEGYDVHVSCSEESIDRYWKDGTSVDCATITKRCCKCEELYAHDMEHKCRL